MLAAYNLPFGLSMSAGIQLALIASTVDTPQFSPLGDIDLAFAHICNSVSHYRDYFQRASRAGRLVILDNGIMELGNTVDDAALVEAVLSICPALVTPPEVLGDGRRTLNLTRDFIRRVPDFSFPSETRLLGVVHGRDWGDWLESYKVFHNEIDQIARIGIPYDIQFEVPGAKNAPNVWAQMVSNRIRVVELLTEFGLNKKPAHLLGLVDAIELSFQSKYRWIVSNDSSTCFVSTQREETYSPLTGIDCRKQKIDMMSIMPPNRMTLFERNLSVIRGFAERKQGYPNDKC